MNLSWRAAAGIGLLLVAVAVGLGLTFGRIARPAAPTPIRVSVTTSPAPSPTKVPIDEATLFKQPVSSACATKDSVFVFTNGGGLLRFDGAAWSQIDDTLRSLTAASCGDGVAYSVGPVGELAIVDDVGRQIRSTAVTTDNLYGVATLTDGALMVGASGAVWILYQGDIQPYAAGIDEDLHDVVAFSLTSAWAVGQNGITYRLDQRGWNPVGSAQTKTLLAIAGSTAADPIAVGEGGVIVRYDNGWQQVTSPVTVTLRDIIVRPAVWIAGEHGTLLTGTLGSLRAVDLHTECDLVSVFSRGDEIWVVGRSPVAGGGIWRLTLDGAVDKHWGGC